MAHFTPGDPFYPITLCHVLLHVDDLTYISIWCLFPLPQARKIAKEEETRKVRNRLARCRARLNTAEQSLTDIVAAGSKGRASAASPTTPLAPTKSSLVPWSDAEVAVLREAVADCGAGQWKLMHEKYKDRFHPVRTRINLRDRYKQLNAKNLW